MAIGTERADGNGGGARAAILEAARRRFLRFGPRKTTMDEIAREAGCSRTTLYVHFRNMEHVYGSLLEGDAEAFIREAETIVAQGGGARRKIRRIVELTRATYARNRLLRLALLRDREMCLEPVAHAFTRDQEQHIIGLLCGVLEEGIAEGTLRPIDPERVAYLMFHLGRVLVEREIAGEGDYPFDEIIGLMDEVFGRGIATPRTEDRGRFDA
ncbi:MAG: TetR/AcrR family transcriptional regulator [Myxococcota bacterium]